MADNMLSIITVCLNSAKTIEQTIKSVLNQSNKNYEHIIIDGGSLDGTIDIIKKYESDLSYWCSEPDNGIYDAMNKGIAEATGTIVSFLNSDDWYRKNTVELVLRSFEKLNNEIIYGDIFNVEEDNSIISYEKAGDIKDIYHGMVICHQAIFAKTNIFKKIAEFDISYRIAADYDWLLRAYNKGISIGYINEAMAYYRKGGFSRRQIILTFEEWKRASITNLPESQKVTMIPIIEAECYERTKNIVLAELRKLPNNDNKHLRKLFYDYVQPDDIVYIWGSGALGKICLTYFQVIGVLVKAVIDSDVKTHNQRLNHVEIVGPDVLKEFKHKVIVTPEKYEIEISNMLKKWDYEDGDYILFSVMIKGMAKLYLENGLI